MDWALGHMHKLPFAHYAVVPISNLHSAKVYVSACTAAHAGWHILEVAFNFVSFLSCGPVCNSLSLGMQGGSPDRRSVAPPETQLSKTVRKTCIVGGEYAAENV